MSGDLHSEVLGWVRELAAAGRRSVTASMITQHARGQGAERSTGAIWSALEDLYCANELEQPGAGTFALPRPAPAVQERMEVGT